MRGGKLVAQATDLSDVIDIRNTSGASTQAAFQVHQLPTQCSRQNNCACMDDGSCQNHGTCSSIHQPCYISREPSMSLPVHQQTHGCTTILKFPAHQGLAVLPRALDPLQQLQLMRAALEQWPDPPTRTNHTKVYGCQLTGLYAAAQAGLSLLQQSNQHAAQYGSQAVGGTASCHGISNNCSCLSPQHQQEGQQSSFTSLSCGHTAAAATDCSRQSSCNNHKKHSCCSDRCCSSCSASASNWSLHGKGPKAAVLLRKLRWASLGPPFNWTDRVYDHHVEYTQLPPELASTASTCAALAALVERNSTDNSITGDCSCVTNSNDRSAAAPGPTQLQPQQQQPKASFRPDVALVNYYHAGDTLGGHKDDVEPDLSQPIVTMSLGCEAVFLMGGQSRDEEPTALLLRSGDVVVLGGRARSCYHGVPRMFTDVALPDDLGTAVEQHPEYKPHFEYFKQCRVNVSVRMVV